MKKIALFLLLQIALFTLYAQQYDPVNPQKDKIDFEGYIIKIIPSQGASYGYEIFKDTRLVVHQSMNPFTMEPIGLHKKEDIYKVARWQVVQLNKNIAGASMRGNGQPLVPQLSTPILDQIPGATEAQYNQPLPKKLAQELNIQLQSWFTPNN